VAEALPPAPPVALLEPPVELDELVMLMLLETVTELWPLPEPPMLLLELLADAELSALETDWAAAIPSNDEPELTPPPPPPPTSVTPTPPDP
jgi:hypothetical protein